MDERISSLPGPWKPFACKDGGGKIDGNPGCPSPVLLTQGKRFPGRELCAGLDSARAIEYEVFWTEGMDWQGIPLTVAWVKERI